MAFVYDLLAIAFLLYYIYVSSRRGLAATVVNFAGYLAALAAAWLLSRTMAPVLFEAFLRDGLVSRVEDALASLPGGIDLGEAASDLLDALPSYLTQMLVIGGYSISELSDRMADYSANAADTLVDEVFAPALTGLVTMILFMVLFSVLMVLVRWLTRCFYGVNRVPIIGLFNSFGGAVVGLLSGVVGLYVIVTLLQFIMVITQNSLSFLNHELLEDTYVYRLYLRFNPLDCLRDLA